MNSTYNYLLDISRYYSAWKDIEESIVVAFNKGGKAQIEAFKDYLTYMKVIRCFRKGSTHEVLTTVEKNKSQTLQVINENLKGFFSRSNMSQAYVAISKILWLYDNNTIIMDNNNINALSCGNDYEQYKKAWLLRYHDYCKGLDSFIEDSNINNYDPIICQEWFKKRVFDMYLWKRSNLK